MYVPINDESEIRDAHDWDYWQTKRSHWTRHNIFFLYLDNNNILLSIILHHIHFSRTIFKMS